MHHVPVPHFDPGFSVHRPKVPGYDQYQGPSNYNQGPYNQAGIFNNQLNGCSSSPCFNGAVSSIIRFINGFLKLFFFSF
jgi:hypothetical protein